MMQFFDEVSGMSLSENEHIVDIDIDVEPAQQPD